MHDPRADGERTSHVSFVSCAWLFVIWLITGPSETFDLESFFKLHDLDQNGYWDRSEIEAVYGVHHDWNPKDKDLAKIKVKADQVVQRVLSLLDKDGDGRVSQPEFEAAGFEGLPNLKELGAEGHHYDVESGKWA